MKKLLFALALLSLAMAVGCAKGGNGIGSQITVTVNGPGGVYPGEVAVFTAVVGPTGTSQTVTWSLSGTACTGTPNPCGSIDATTGAYTAPGTPPSPSTVVITATSQADTTATGSENVDVVLVSVVVTPTAVTVGENLVQTFTAVAVPDAAPQTFTWTCTPTGSCGTLTCGSGNPTCSNPTSVPPTYTAPPSTGSVAVVAQSNVPQPTPGSGQSKVSVTAARLSPGTYAFRFSGYDSTGKPVKTAGSVSVTSQNGQNNLAGTEDVVMNFAYHQYAVTGSFTPNGTSNDLGTLVLAATGGPTFTYAAAVSASGVQRFISADSGISGSGAMVKSAANTVFNAGAQTFAFGFNGIDGSNRVGYVGLLPLDGVGNVGKSSPALMDSNDTGSATKFCGTPPCTVTGTYSYTASSNVGQMALTVGASTLHFDFFVAGGAAETKTTTNPLTLFAISTDPLTNPIMSGSMVYQVPMTYNNAAFKGSSVSALTGLNTNSSGVAQPNTSNVALVVGQTDGTSSGTGGAGGFTGSSDQNNNGTPVSITATSPFSYTYLASSASTGRYTIQMLGNPSANPVVSPMTFILYASGANRGFLLDASTQAVMTGTLNPQITPNSFFYTATELPGVFAAETTGSTGYESGTSALVPNVQNLLLTSTGMVNGSPTLVVNGTETYNNGTGLIGFPIGGSYTLVDNSAGGGTGTITLTNPTAPAVTNYVIYAVNASTISGTSNNVITDFYMMGLTSGTPSPIVFAQQ